MRVKKKMRKLQMWRIVSQILYFCISHMFFFCLNQESIFSCLGLCWGFIREPKGPGFNSSSGGWGFGLQSGYIQEATKQCFSLTLMFLSLSVSLSSSLPKSIICPQVRIKNIYIKLKKNLCFSQRMTNSITVGFQTMK